MGIRGMFTSLASDISVNLSVIPLGGETIVDPAGGYTTRLLGYNRNATLPGSTISITTSTTPNVIYRAGPWVTPYAPKNLSAFTRYIKANASFFFHKIFGYESASNLDAYFCWRCSLLEYTPGVGDIHTNYTYRALRSTGSGWFVSNHELGTASVSQHPYGGATGGTGGSDALLVETQRELKQDDRILIEWGIKETGNRAGTVHFEFGGPGDMTESPVSGVSIAYGSECVIPINFDEQWEEHWGIRDELMIGYGDPIDWTNINATRTWQSIDWIGSGRLVNRRGSGNNISQQMWCKHDRYDFMYITLNNIIDSCIQYSDHASLFICGSNNWRAALIPDWDDWLFTIDINGSQSQTTAPSSPYTEGGGTEYGPRIWRGGEGYGAGQLPDVATFPYGWEMGTFWAGGTAGTPRGFQFKAHDTAVVSDTFTGTPNTTLSTYNANWIQYSYLTGTMQLNAGGTAATAPGGQVNPGGYYYNVGAGGSNHAVEVDWTPSVLGTSWNGVFLKIDPLVNGTHYEVRFRSNAGTGDVELRRFNNGTPTTLQTTTVANITATNAIRVRALFQNGALRIYFNSKLIIEYNDSQSQLTNSGYCGIFLTDTNNSFDNFAVGRPTVFDAVFWEEGVDFRMASETGGCTTAPDPNTNDVSVVPKSARTTFKIRKSKIGPGWNGLYPLGFMLNNQCDVAGNGSMMFPGSLGNQLDKPHWNYMGPLYAYTENKTAAASASTGSTMDLRPIFSGHLHDEHNHEYFFSGVI